MKIKKQLLSADGDTLILNKERTIRISAQLAAIVSSMQDAKKRDEFINALSYLTKQEQDALKQRLDAAPSDLDRWMILSDIVNTIKSSQGYQISENAEQLEAKRKKQMLAFSLLALLVGSGLIYLIIKRA